MIEDLHNQRLNVEDSKEWDSFSEITDEKTQTRF